MSNGAPAHSDGHTPPHPYHLVNPSPWPLVGAFGAFLMTFGAVRWWQGSDRYVLYAGLAVVLLTMFMWWRAVIHEAQVEKVHTPTVRHGLRFGMALFITSEVMFLRRLLLGLLPQRLPDQSGGDPVAAGQYQADGHLGDSFPEYLAAAAVRFYRDLGASCLAT